MGMYSRPDHAEGFPFCCRDSEIKGVRVLLVPCNEASPAICPKHLGFQELSLNLFTVYLEERFG